MQCQMYVLYLLLALNRGQIIWLVNPHSGGHTRVKDSQPDSAGQTVARQDSDGVFSPHDRREWYMQRSIQDVSPVGLGVHVCVWPVRSPVNKGFRFWGIYRTLIIP